MVGAGLYDVDIYIFGGAHSESFLFCAVCVAPHTRPLSRLSLRVYIYIYICEHTRLSLSTRTHTYIYAHTQYIIKNINTHTHTHMFYFVNIFLIITYVWGVISDNTQTPVAPIVPHTHTHTHTHTHKEYTVATFFPSGSI